MWVFAIGKGACKRPLRYATKFLPNVTTVPHMDPTGALVTTVSYDGTTGILVSLGAVPLVP